MRARGVAALTLALSLPTSSASSSSATTQRGKAREAGRLVSGGCRIGGSPRAGSTTKGLRAGASRTQQKRRRAEGECVCTPETPHEVGCHGPRGTSGWIVRAGLVDAAFCASSIQGSGSIARPTLAGEIDRAGPEAWTSKAPSHRGGTPASGAGPESVAASTNGPCGQCLSGSEFERTDAQLQACVAGAPRRPVCAQCRVSAVESSSVRSRRSRRMAPQKPLRLSPRRGAARPRPELRRGRLRHDRGRSHPCR